MVTMIVQLDENLAERLHELAESQERTPEDLVVEAVARLTATTARPMPKGMGAYHSGDTSVSQNAREILRDAARSGEWP